MHDNTFNAVIATVERKSQFELTKKTTSYSIWVTDYKRLPFGRAVNARIYLSQWQAMKHMSCAYASANDRRSDIHVRLDLDRKKDPGWAALTWFIDNHTDVYIHFSGKRKYYYTDTGEKQVTRRPFQYKDSCVKIKTISRLSYLYIGILGAQYYPTPERKGARIMSLIDYTFVWIF